MTSESPDDNARPYSPPPPRRPWQFSLASLFMVTTLVAICAAAWMQGPVWGFFTTLIIVDTFLTVWRILAELAAQLPIRPKRYSRSFLAIIVEDAIVSSVAVVISTNVTFVLGVVAFDVVAGPITSALFAIRHDDELFHLLYLAVGLLGGTAVAIWWLRVTWPRRTNGR